MTRRRTSWSPSSARTRSGLLRREPTVTPTGDAILHQHETPSSAPLRAPPPRAHLSPRSATLFNDVTLLPLRAVAAVPRSAGDATTHDAIVNTMRYFLSMSGPRADDGVPSQHVAHVCCGRWVWNPGGSRAFEERDRYPTALHSTGIFIEAGRVVASSPPRCGGWGLIHYFVTKYT